MSRQLTHESAARTPGSNLPGRRRFAAALALTALTLIALGGVVELGFVGLDDPQYVQANPIVLRGLTLDGLRYACGSVELGNWHPLTWLSHMLTVEAFGADARAHHAVNLALHLANVLLVYLVLERASGETAPSLLVAALFAIHPLHVESVAWVAERKDVLSGCFWLCATYAYVRWTQTRLARWYAALLLFTLCGMASKPMLVTLPCTLLLLDHWPLGRWTRPRDLGRLLLEKAPLFALSAVFSALALYAQRSAGATGGGEGLGAAVRVATALRACGVYLLQTFRPSGLAVFYPYPREPDMGAAALAALALALITAAVVAARRRAPWGLVGWLWFLGTLVPVLGFVQVGFQAHADRYTYIPHIGLFMALCWWAVRIAGDSRVRRWSLGVAGAAAACALVLATRAQVAVWRDDETLFSHAVAVTQDNYLAHDALGRVLLQRGELELAEQHLRAALAAGPEFASPYNNLGNLLAARGDLAGACESFQRATELEPQSSAAWANLGGALGRLGIEDQAAEALDRALDLAPRDPVARHNAALNELQRGDRAAAIAHFRVALEVRPELGADPTALLFAWILSTDPDPACRDGALAVRLAEPFVQRTAGRDVQCLETLAAALAESGRFDEAGARVRQAQGLPAAGTSSELSARLAATLALYEADRPMRVRL
jgi:protein O-mannosyl-transferase